jgi:CPA2 family monovalent cation:H+ antiporter-2
MAVATESYAGVLAFLATAGVVAPLVKRLKISPILGFLAAGVILGPYGLGRFVGKAPWLAYVTVARPERIHAMAELGVVFLLFSIGLELSWERLRVMRGQVFGYGALLTLGSAALFAAAALAFGGPPGGAATLGCALAMSSTAIVLPVMAETGRMQSRSGRAVFAVLLFQDLAVAPILIAISLATPTETLHSPVAALATAVLGVGGIILAGRLVLRPLFRSAARAKSQDLFMAASLLVIIGAGLSAELLGLSMALGAFIAGLLLAETEFRHEIEVLIGPFRDLLLGLFFVSVGIGLNLDLLAAQPWLILAAAAGLVAVKAALGAGLGRLIGLAGGAALESGLLIAAGGEFAFVILDEARHAELLPAQLAQAMQVSVTLSMFAIPGLGALGARLGRAHTAAEHDARAAPPPAPAAEPRVLIIGYGRVGRIVGEMLTRHELAWIAVDRDFHAVEAARGQGREVYYGDASRPELLTRCGLMSAPGVVLTTDAPDAAEAVAAAVRRLRPDVVMVARARDARHARRLYELGATDAVPETIEASLQLSEAVLVDLGVPMGFVIASIHEKRDEIRKSLNVSGERQDPPETAEGAEKPRRTLRGRAGRTRSAPSTEG